VVDCFAGVGWMGVAMELVVVGGWDCVVVVVELFIETGAIQYTEVAEVDFGGDWVNVEEWLSDG
jgi:hypothetical protein